VLLELSLKKISIPVQQSKNLFTIIIKYTIKIISTTIKPGLSSIISIGYSGIRRNKTKPESSFKISDYRDNEIKLTM
jgi:hypothetical protein